MRVVSTVSLERVKFVALLTVVMSIPLLLTLWKPEIGDIEGPPSFLFYWLSLSVLMVPVLLVVGLVTTITIVKSSNQAKRALLCWNLAGILVAIAAEMVFVAYIYRPLP